MFYLRQDSKLVHAVFEVIFELDKLAHVFLQFYRAEQGCVHKGWAQSVDPHPIVTMF